MSYNISNVISKHLEAVMSFIGKLHEISLYGLITNIICLFTGKTMFSALYEAVFRGE